MDINIIRLPEEKLEEAVTCLVTAFQDDPIFEYFFPEGGDQKTNKMRALFEAGCRYRLLNGEPILALELDGEIVAVANVTTPDKPEDTDEVKQLWANLGTALGNEAEVQFDTYSSTKEKHTPDFPHHYVVSLAVKPGHQGCGLGGKLLEAVCQLPEDHPTSKATVLDTGTDINLKFYYKHRFQLISSDDLDGVPCYWLIRNCQQ